MQINEMPFEDAIPVEGYGEGFFRIGGAVHEGPLVLVRAEVRPWGGMDDHATLLALAGQIDVLLIGTGAEMAYLPKTLTAALEEVGIGVEGMSSPTAARSYNVLASEGRRVAVALLPV